MSEAIGIGRPVHDIKSAIMDIVFVHGLFGDRTATWTYEGASDDEKVFWPRDLLPEDMKETRILSFGYDANIASTASQPSENDFKDHANNLLAAIAGQRTEKTTANRPLVLVAHSLGGLVCAEAMLSATRSADTDLQSVEKSTKGIIFLGTPFGGAKVADLDELLRRMYSLVKSTNSEILHDLRPDSKSLTELVQNFALWLLQRSDAGSTGDFKVDIVCFFEEMKTKKPGIDKKVEAPGLSWFARVNKSQIVLRESAYIDGYEIQFINADHIGMCKFKSATDDNYRKILGVLERWAAKLSNNEEVEKPEPIGCHILLSGQFH